MYIYYVIPLTKLPRLSLQMPAYYSAESFSVGQLVEVPLGSRKVAALVVQVGSAKDQKQFIKKVPFTLRGIKNELTPHPVFNEEFIKLGITLADYYFSSFGLMLQRMLPPFFSKPNKPLLDLLKKLPEPPARNKKNTGKKILLIGSDRSKHYKKYLEKEGTIMIVPQYLQLEHEEKRFEKNKFSVVNSGMSQVSWRNTWRDAYTGDIENLLGTRAVLFTPLKNLRTIIIENENNTSHVSWDLHPKFDTRHTAEIISDLYGVDIIEGDILPSVEKYHKAKNQEWQLIKEPSELSPAKLIDMREEIKKDNKSIFSEEVEHMLKNLNKNEKVLMLITRKGLSSAIICRDCGYIVNCPECEAPTVLHESAGAHILICHHCGKKIPAPNICPSCNGSKIREIGGGTQRALKEAIGVAPHLSIEHMDSDVATNTDKQKEIFARFKKGDTNVLIATQIALKDYMLPKLDYSVALMLDAALYLPEYRSAEKIFESIWRLRHMTQKGLLIQTYHPEMSVFKHGVSKRFEPFYEEELKKRQIFSWPPYSQLIKLSFKDKSPQKAQQEAAVMAQKLKTQIKNLQSKKLSGLAAEKCEVLGPAPAFVPKVAGKYIWYILIKWPKKKNGEVEDLHSRNALLEMAAGSWEVEVDPVNIV
ncbi:MAG: primosomal protein N' [Candidatus Spechtbacterales bacterium]